MIEITPMTPQDLAAVVELESRSHLEPWSEEAFRSELAKGFAHGRVARVFGRRGAGDALDTLAGLDGGRGDSDSPEKRIVGYICFWVLLDEIHILNVTVDADHRGQGVGSALLLHALNLGWHSGGRVALLEVRGSNAAALALYRRLGFTEVGERPGYYGVVRESALVMALEMDAAWRRSWPDDYPIPAG